jgi:hypothetical protein
LPARWIYGSHALASRHARRDAITREENMLTTLLLVLLALWLIGTVSSYTMGGFIHVLLVVALALFVLRMIQGRRVTG